MKFKVENGSDNISIGLSEIGSYFRFDNPLSVVWLDNSGTVAKYFCLLPYNKTYRDELKNKLVTSLNQDFSDNIGELYVLLEPLFSLFKNGNYSLGFSRENMFSYQTSTDKYTEIHYHPLELAFTEASDVSEVELAIEKHKAFLTENAITKQRYSSRILEYTTYNLYDPSHCFFATQPNSFINQDRVSYFEEQITAGERPFAIIMQAYMNSSDLYSSYFILDGHHKLLAYQKLKVYPAIALISYIPSSIEELEFDVEKLSTTLYPWQIADILTNWDEKDDYILEKLKNPNSPLHNFIKNGYVKEYHENKSIKHEAFYINDKVEGKSLEWYDNGQLKCEYFYKNGRRTGVCKNYYPSGKIQYVEPFDEMNRYDGDIIAYYENGQKSRIESMKNGRNVDGFTSTYWFENGNKSAENCYLDGRVVERKNWDSQGRVYNHEIYDEELKRLVKKAATVQASYQNKHERPEDILEKNLNIIRERQYPDTSDKAVWRIVVLLILISLYLLRMCK